MIKQMQAKLIKLCKCKQQLEDSLANDDLSEKEYNEINWRVTCLSYSINKYNDDLKLAIANKLIGEPYAE